MVKFIYKDIGAICFHSLKHFPLVVWKFSQPVWFLLVPCCRKWNIYAHCILVGILVGGGCVSHTQALLTVDGWESPLESSGISIEERESWLPSSSYNSFLRTPGRCGGSAPYWASPAPEKGRNQLQISLISTSLAQSCWYFRRVEGKVPLSPADTMGRRLECQVPCLPLKVKC